MQNFTQNSVGFQKIKNIANIAFKVSNIVVRIRKVSVCAGLRQRLLLKCVTFKPLKWYCNRKCHTSGIVRGTRAQNFGKTQTQLPRLKDNKNMFSGHITSYFSLF